MHQGKERFFFYPLGNSSTGPDTEIPPTAHGGKVEPEGPALAAGGTSNTSSRIPSVEDGMFWGGVIGGIVIVAITIAVAIIRRKSTNRRKRDAITSAGEDRLNKQQRRPLMSSAKPSEFYYTTSPISHPLSLLRGVRAHWANG